MALKTGSVIGGYRLLRDFEGGANCRWSFADRGGTEFFVEEFYRPKYPPDLMTGPLRDEKIRRCTLFEALHHRPGAALGRIEEAGGDVVAPVGFFRQALTYYHVAPRIEPASLAPADVAALPAGRRLGLLRRLSRALVALHGQRIAHGDLKPSNILIHLTPRGALRPRLIDFDGAFFFGEPPDRDEMAFDQNYVAPEILAYCGNPNVTPAGLGTTADVFSACVLIHEYWTGRGPSLAGGLQYAAEAAQAGAAIRVEAPGMDPPLARLLRQGLALDPAARPSIGVIDQAIEAAHWAAGATPLTLAPRDAIFPEAESSHSLAASVTRPSAQESLDPRPTAPSRPRPYSPLIRKSKNLEPDDL